MKSVQPGKAIPTNTNMKSKKNSKDKEKRRSTSQQENDKSFNSKVSHTFTH